MAQIEFEDFILEYVPTALFDRDVVIDGVRTTNEHMWWLRPTFIGQLEKPTIKYFKKFLSDNEEEIRDKAYDGPWALEYLELAKYRDEDEELVVSPRGTSSSSLLFPVQEDTNVKRVYVYDGIDSSDFPFRYFTYPYEVDDIEDGPMAIQAWNYKPIPRFMHLKKEKSALFFGLELEVNTQIPWSDMYRVMTEVHPIQEDFMYAMSDSSISGMMDHHYEMVTRPMTPRRMRKEFRIFFTKLESLCKDKLGKSLPEVLNMDTSSTGLHIHASRKAFASKFHRRRFLTLFNSDVPQINKFISKLALRKINGSQYAKPNYSYEGRRLGYCLSPRFRNQSDRYCACTETSQTIEVRIFRGLPTLNNINHCIDTVEAMFNFSMDIPLSSFKFGFESTFQKWLKTQPKQKYRTLKETLSCV